MLIFSRPIRDGYRAAVVGIDANANPWIDGTIGHLAWSFGWNLGSLLRRGAR